MRPKIVHAKDKKVLKELSNLFIESKYKIQAEDENFTLLKRNYYGNIILHLIFIFIALFISQLAFIFNIIYFAYSLFNRSNVVLITTETLDDDGRPLEFDDVRDIQMFYSQDVWDRAIELSELE